MEDINETKESHFFRTLFFLIILVIILIILYGKYIEPTLITMKEYSVNSEKFPSSFQNFKIIHFADILYDDKNDIDTIDKIVEKINYKDSDIVIFSGGLTNKKYNLDENEINTIKEKLSKINSVYGKYYVSGKYDKNNQSYDSIMQGSGFISLNDNKDIIYSKNKEKILLLGIDSKSDKAFIRDSIKDDESTYKIAFFHESDVFEDLDVYGFDLALSSNSLNGQINIPLIKESLLDKDSKTYYKPYYKVDNTDFYITNGIGNYNFDFRLLNKPSINLYILNKK